MKTNKVQMITAVLLAVTAAMAAPLFAQTEAKQGTSFLEGTWLSISSTESTALGLQFLMSGSVSAKILIFKGNKYYTGVSGVDAGLMGRASREGEGTFRINTAGKTLDLIDDFGDIARHRYVLSETEEELVLKLKDSDGNITTWYKSKS
jgi:hypothetical protein